MAGRALGCGGPDVRAGTGESPRGPDLEVRCGCGSLLARVVEGRVELKCRRCKRVWQVPVEAG